MRYRLLAIDIDGTLVNSRHELTAATRDALRRAVASGVRVVLATGRRYSRTLPLAQEIGIGEPLVTASGALIKRPSDHETLFCASLDRALLLEMLAHIASAGYEAVLYADSFHRGFDYYCERVDVESPELAEYLRFNAGSERLWRGLMRDPPEGIFGGFVTSARRAMLDLHHALQATFPDRLHTHVLRSPRYQGFMCEIAPAGVTKWSGISHLAREWGIGDSEICAVGDDVNDLPMIAAAGLGVAMSNARPEVLAAADRVAPSNDEDGLARVVEWVLEANR